MLENNENEKIAVQVSLVTIAINVLLAIIKFLAGFLGHSVALVSDAVHSLSDVLSTFVVIVGVKIANKKADADHPYGHERFESIGSIVLSFLLIFVAFGIGMNGIERIFSQSYLTNDIPTSFALYSALVSILIKEGMYWYTIYSAKKINSDLLRADAWHHRSDALSSIGSFVAVLGAMMGFPILDPLAACLIAFFIMKVSYEIFLSSVNKLTDKSCDTETITSIKNLILQNKSVRSIDDFKTRVFENKVFIDLEIAVSPQLSIVEAHSIAEQVHTSVESSFSQVKHCMIHVNPYGEGKSA